MQNTLSMLHNPRSGFPTTCSGEGIEQWTPAPSLSAPAHRRAKPKTAFESSSKTLQNYFGYFLHQVEIEVIRGQRCQIDDSCFQRNLTSDKGHVGSQFTKWPNYIKLDVSRRGLTRGTQWHQFHVSIPFWSQVIGIKKVGDLRWPQVTFKGVSK